MTGAKRMVSMLAVALTAACGYVDLEAPPKPRFALASDRPVTWRVASIDVEGSAEYGATVELTSDKSFGGQPAPKAQLADDFTARFRFAGVGLAAGTNTLSLVATDAAGNKSEAATLVVEYADSPETLDLRLSSGVIVAGSTGSDGKLTATAHVVGGVDGFVVKDRKILFEVTGVATAAKDAQTDDSGRASVTFDPVDHIGSGLVSAYFLTKEGKKSTEPFSVIGGPAAVLTLQVAKVGGTPGDAVTVKAGEDVDATIAVKDGQGNAVTVPTAIYTDAPGALVSGTKLTNLKVAGTWKVVGAVNGAPTAGGAAVSDSATITIQPSDGFAVTLDAPAEATAGLTTRFTAAVTDTFGNPVAPGAGRTITFSVEGDAAAEVSDANRTVIFKKSGIATLKASLSGSPPVTVTRDVVVKPGVAAALVLGVGGQSACPATPFIVSAGAAATLATQTTAKDAFGNVTAAPVALTTNASAAFDGTTLKGLSKAGDYEVRAEIPNAAIAARCPFVVKAGASTSILFELGASSVEAGNPLLFRAFARDSLGNATDDAVVVVVDGLQASDVTVDATAGTLSVKKSAAVAYTVRAKPASGTTPAAVTLPLTVRPAAPEKIGIDIAGANTVLAGATPDLAITVRDRFDNAISSPSLSVSIVPGANTLVDPPGPVFSAGKIYNLVRPGSYKVVAQVTGTALVNDQNDAESTLVVGAGASTSTDLVLSRSSADAGSPVDFKVTVRDAYGNTTADTAAVTVFQGTTTIATNVVGSWTPQAAGTFVLEAKVTAVSPNLVDRETLVVAAAADVKGPTLTMARPLNSPTITAWPPGDKVATTCTGGAEGDTVSVSATDASLVERAWITVAGPVANASSGAMNVPFPVQTQAGSAAVCATPSATNGGLTRGEVIVDFGASDLRGNYTSMQGGWCVDPDVAGYLPANPPVQRCAVLKGNVGASGIYGLAANDTGDLAVAREAGNGNAQVHLFTRISGTYGLGAAHAIQVSGSPVGAPRGVAFAGQTAFTSTISSTKTFVVRTLGLDATGAGTDDAFVNIDTSSSNDRFEGVLVNQDADLIAVLAPRTATTLTSKIYQFTGALDPTKTVTTLPSSALVTSTTTRFAAICKGARAGEIYALGRTTVSSATRAIAARIVGGTVTTLFQDTVDDRTFGGCALTQAGLVVTVLKTGQATQISVIDTGAGTLAATPYWASYATGTDLAQALGVTLASGFIFVGTTEGSNGSLLRVARTGGF